MWSGLLLGLVVLTCWLSRKLRTLPSDCSEFPEMDERHLSDHR